MEERNDIVIYQSEDGLVKMEAKVDSVHETIWATQKAIAALFGKDVPIFQGTSAMFIPAESSPRKALCKKCKLLFPTSLSNTITWT